MFLQELNTQTFLEPLFLSDIVKVSLDLRMDPDLHLNIFQGDVVLLLLLELQPSSLDDLFDVQLLKRIHQPIEDLIVRLSLATEELEPVFNTLIDLDSGAHRGTKLGRRLLKIVSIRNQP